MKQFTNLYQVAKTLRFELIPDDSTKPLRVTIFTPKERPRSRLRRQKKIFLLTRAKEPHR